MFACEDSTSIDCAREMRGSHSIANAVTPRLASASMPGALNGSSRPTRMELLFSKSNSASVGARTFSTIWASYASAAEPTSLAPAAAKSESRMLDPAPGGFGRGGEPNGVQGRPGQKAEGRSGLPRAARHLRQAGVGIARDRQKRVEEQRDQRRPHADAAGDWDQEGEQREGRDGLHQ